MKISIKALTFTLLSVSLFTSFSANALDACPVEFGNDNYLEKVAELATNAGSCWEASEVVEACALGASGDVFTVGAAIGRCEKDIPAMSRKDKKNYSYLKEKCNAKYDKMDGTMYRSMNAFCHLSVAKLYVDLLSTEE